MWKIILNVSSLRIEKWNRIDHRKGFEAILPDVCVFVCVCVCVCIPNNRVRVSA